MSGDIPNGFVTWRNLVWVVITVFGICGGAAGYALNAHSSFRHKGTISEQEYYGDQRDLKEDIREIKQLLKEALAERRQIQHRQDSRR